MKARGLALAAVLCAAAGAGAETPAEKAVREYAAADDAARAGLRAALREHDAIQPADVKKWIEFTRRALLARGTHDGKPVSTLRHKDFPVQYKVMGNTKGRDRSLLIALHGGGAPEVNDAQWDLMVQKAGAAKSAFDIVVVPRIWKGREESWGTADGMIWLPALLAELRRTYAIDSNRVALYGASLGGFGSTCLGASRADLFSAIGAELCAADYGGSWENLANTALTIHIGEKDTDSDRIGLARKLRDAMQKGAAAQPGRYRLEYKEYPGLGHTVPPTVAVEIFAWMKAFKRDPAPRSVVWRGFRSSDGRPDPNEYFWWLHAVDRGLDFRLEATIGDKNRIEVKTAGVRSFTLFLNDRLVNLKQPVTVVVDGVEKYSARPALSLSAVVETWVAREDPEMVATVRIDVAK